jgi:uncharacterized protein YqjF (DUF2071 family)
MELLKSTGHRPWAPPSEPWLMTQIWYDLLFAHWPVPLETLRSLIPPGLPLDTFEGQAWLSITPFHLSIQPRALPLRQHFPELNCRTYVTLAGKPGIFFFSLDAGSRTAVWGARTFYRLPYYHAKMRVKKQGSCFVYDSRRGAAQFQASYQPEGAVHRSSPGTLEHWLSERYCLYTTHQNKPYRAEIHHLPWPLQPASAAIRHNTIAEAAGIELPSVPPVLAFARELEVLVWRLREVS